jgi:hypothetical protein
MSSESSAFRRDPAIVIRALALQQDMATLHRWFTMDCARFWGMQDHTEAQTHEAYRLIMASGHACAYLGLFDGTPSFMFECYDPACDELGAHYVVRPGDLGMHFFVGPPQGPRIPDFTRRALRALMGFLFEQRHARRIVVEPDLRNQKVHVLNREMGFVYQRAVQLNHKRAALAFCSREDFFAVHQPTSRKEPAA